MMGQGDPQRTFFYNISLETFVPQEHPLRAIRPLIDDATIRRVCRDLYSPIGRPSIPPEQLFLALVGGYLLGVTSDRKLVVELHCNMALRWFVGLNLDQEPWDASTFSQNRRRRFDESGVLEHLFDETVKRAMAAGLVSRHVSADGTLVRANASYKSFLPIEVALDPEEYKRRPRREAQQCDAPLAHRSGLSVRLQGRVGDGSLSRLHRECADGESAPRVARPRRRDLSLERLGNQRVPGLAAPRAPAAALHSAHAGCRQGLFQRSVHRGSAQARRRAPCGGRRSEPSPGAHPGPDASARTRLPAVATLPEENRRAVRRGQRLAWPAAVPTPRPGACPPGDLLDRLGPQSQTSRSDPTAASMSGAV